MRVPLLCLLFQLGAVAASEDAVAIFRSCAYTYSLPTDTTPELEFKLVRPDGGALPPDHRFAASERFRLEVSGRREGYLYIFQEPADPASLVFPGAAGDRNRLTRTTLLSVPLYFDSPATTTLLLGVAAEPIPNAEAMTAEQFRAYFARRAHCWGKSFEQMTLSFRSR